MKNNAKKYLIISLIIIIGLGIMAGMRLKQLKNVSVSKAAAGYPVETVIASKDTISKELSYVGTVESWEEVDLAAKISARIINIAGKEGDPVQKGQVVVSLDNGDLQGKIKTLEQKVHSAKVNLDYWESQVQLYDTLLKEGAISEQEFYKIGLNRDLAATGYAEAQSTLQEARINLENSTIPSSISGTILTVHSNPGDMAVPGKPLITVGNTNRLKVKVKVVEQDLLQMKTGQPVFLSLSNSSKPYSAKVKDIFPSLDKTYRTGTIEIAIPQELSSDYNLKPGMSINVFFVIGQKQKAIVVPKHTILTDNDNSAYVYIVNNGKAVKKTVKTGLTNDRFAEITHGLNEGDQVISSGLTEVYDGRPLYIAGRKG